PELHVHQSAGPPTSTPASLQSARTSQRTNTTYRGTSLRPSTRTRISTARGIELASPPPTRSTDAGRRYHCGSRSSFDLSQSARLRLGVLPYPRRLVVARFAVVLAGIVARWPFAAATVWRAAQTTSALAAGRFRHPFLRGSSTPSRG